MLTALLLHASWYHSIFILFVIVRVDFVSFRGIRLLQVLILKLFILEVSRDASPFVATPLAGASSAPLTSMNVVTKLIRNRSKRFSSARVYTMTAVLPFRSPTLSSYRVGTPVTVTVTAPIAPPTILFEFFVFISGVFCRSGGDGSTKRE